MCCCNSQFSRTIFKCQIFYVVQRKLTFELISILGRYQKMFYLHVPDINVSITDVGDSALVRLEHFATYTKLRDKPKNKEYLKNLIALDYAGFLCLREKDEIIKQKSYHCDIIQSIEYEINNCYSRKTEIDLDVANIMQNFGVVKDKLTQMQNEYATRA